MPSKQKAQRPLLHEVKPLRVCHRVFLGAEQLDARAAAASPWRLAPLGLRKKKERGSPWDDTGHEGPTKASQRGKPKGKAKGENVGVLEVPFDTYPCVSDFCGQLNGDRV